MPDKITKEQRSYIMSQIRGTKTKPELIVKDNIDGRRLRYQPKGIPERPDFAIFAFQYFLFDFGGL